MWQQDRRLEQLRVFNRTFVRDEEKKGAEIRHTDGLRRQQFHYSVSIGEDIWWGHSSVADRKMIVAEVSVSVLGEGSSISRFVRVAVASLKQSGLKTVSGPNGTSLEAASIDEILDAVKAAHLAVVETGAKRVVTTLKIDDRRDKVATMQTKLKAVN
jgi:uncharacterized protein (TIGR00106 family)